MKAFDEQLRQMSSAPGFIAALDQSGGSTPKTLRNYGVDRDDYGDEEEMFDQVHAMRSRVIRSPAFSRDRIIGAILFEQTMDREIEGRPTAEYLWEVKSIVPFLKVDSGLAEASGGMQMMKKMPNLDQLLNRAKDAGIFGTKMRSVIGESSAGGIKAVVDQQFEYGRRICAAGFVPIIEPEVDIHATDKEKAEALLLEALLAQLENLANDERVIFKLTLPEKAGLYQPLQEHPNVVRVVALSGGYSRDEANSRLAQNKGMIASFSRALLEDLRVSQSEEEFNATLKASVESIYEAAIT